MGPLVFDVDDGGVAGSGNCSSSKEVPIEACAPVSKGSTWSVTFGRAAGSWIRSSWARMAVGLGATAAPPGLVGSAGLGMSLGTGLLPGPKITCEQVDRRELYVHPLPGPKSLQVRVGRLGVNAAPRNGEQVGDYADCGDGLDSSLPRLGSSRVIIADEPSCPDRLKQRDARCFPQVVKCGVGAANRDISLNAFRRDEQVLLDHLYGHAEPSGGPVAGTSCLRVRRPTAALPYQLRLGGLTHPAVPSYRLRKTAATGAQ